MEPFPGKPERPLVSLRVAREPEQHSQNPSPCSLLTSLLCGLADSRCRGAACCQHAGRGVRCSPERLERTRSEVASSAFLPASVFLGIYCYGRS